MSESMGKIGQRCLHNGQDYSGVCEAMGRIGQECPRRVRDWSSVWENGQD